MAIKFGLGSYEHTQPGAPSTIQARIYFLTTVEEIEPQVVTSLYDGAFYLFLYSIHLHFAARIPADKPLEDVTISEALSNIRRHVPAEEVKDLLPSWKALTKRKAAATLVKPLKAWAQSWQLTDEWCLDYATRTLRMWLYRENQRSQRAWRNAHESLSVEDSSMMSNAIWENTTMRDVFQFHEEAYGNDPSGYGFHFDYQGFSFKDSGWHPFYEEIGEWNEKITGEFLSRLDVFRREHNRIPKGVKQAFNRAKKEHIDKLRAAVRKLGLKPAPKKWDFKHFRWLIYYQVQKPNWSLERIAEEYGTDFQTVSSGIKRTAKLIGLTLRSPLPAGRKPSRR